MKMAMNRELYKSATFEFKPAPHVKVSKVLNLQDDLAMALKAETIRIQAPIPVKDVSSPSVEVEF